MIGAGGGGRIHGIEGRFVQFLRAIMACLPPLAISSVCRIFFLASISNVSFARGRVCGGERSPASRFVPPLIVRQLLHPIRCGCAPQGRGGAELVVVFCSWSLG